MPMDVEEFLRLLEDANASGRGQTKRADNINPIVTTDTGPSETAPNPNLSDVTPGVDEEEVSELLNAVSSGQASGQVGGDVKVTGTDVDVDKVIEETAKKIVSEGIVDDPEAAAVIADAIVASAQPENAGQPEKTAEAVREWKQLGKFWAFRNIGLI